MLEDGRRRRRHSWPDVKKCRPERGGAGAFYEFLGRKISTWNEERRRQRPTDPNFEFLTCNFCCLGDSHGKLMRQLYFDAVPVGYRMTRIASLNAIDVDWVPHLKLDRGEIEISLVRFRLMLIKSHQIFWICPRSECA